MKKHIILLYLLAPFFNVFAQPGDVENFFRYKEYKIVQDSIIEYPKNLFYKWVQLDIVFKPRFNLYTKSTAQVKEYFKHYNLYREYDGPDSIIVSGAYKSEMGSWRKKVKNHTREMGDYLVNNKSELIKVLDVLIKKNRTYKDRQIEGLSIYYYSGDKPTYLYRRGQLYYLNGEPDKAKEDYLSALENEPTNDLKKEILLSMAAYYYTQDSLTEETQRQALNYLEAYNQISSRDDYFSRLTYETEKINLLKSLKDSTTLVNYFHDQAARCWKKYYDQLKIGAYKGDGSISDAIRYEQLLFEYLKELNPEFSMEDFKNHKDIIVQKL